MSKLGVVLAVAALGLAAYVAMEMNAREARLAALEDNLNHIQGSVSDMDAKLDRMLAAAGEAEAALLAADGGASGDTGSSGAVGLEGRRPPTAVERLAALEKTVADQRETIAKLEKKSEGPSTGHLSAPSPLRISNFYHNLDSASKALGLNDRQKADMQDAIDIAKRELDDLYNTENDDGETWSELKKGKMTTLGDSGLTVSMPDFKKIAAFKKQRVPGTAETFGEAEKRIKKRAFGDMRRGLTDEQAKKWDDARKDPLLGGGGVTSAFVTTIGPPSSDD